MAYTTLLSFSVCFLVVIHGCFAQLGRQQQQQQWQGQQQQQQHQLRAKTECRIQSLNALEPNRRFESEAGVTEFWDPNNEQLDCAGVAAVRNIIQPKGLRLPYYTNTPQLIYIIKGRGIQGTVLPGCAETYESESQSGGDRRRRFTDRHQKIRRFREGDILALPAGVTHWAYNDGEEPLVSVSLLDVSNQANQLDQNFRKFFLAGNPQGEQQGRGGEEQEGERRRREEQEGRGRWPRGGSQHHEAGNIFNGFDEQILAEAFNVDAETVRKLQGQNDDRGRIVRVERGLDLVVPEREEEEEERRHQVGYNGLEETICTLKLRENIADSRRADVFNPRGGRVSTLNSHNLPILNFLQLSAERGILYRNAMLAPHWNMNAHSIIYVIRGSGRLQIVGNGGRSVFNDRVQEGQLITVPQNFAVVKRAGEQGLEWVAFKTNDNAMTSPLAGRLSVLRAMPEEVLMNSYAISREDARNVKYNRDELTVFGPGSRSRERV